MRILIITVFDSYNWGSYLQASALSKVLKQHGTTYFLRTGSRGIILPFLKQFIKSIFQLNIKRILFEIRKYKIFYSNLKTLSVVKCLPDDNADVLLVFGSDEIWNLSRKKMLKFPIFWGKGCEGFKKISYSPTINNASIDEYKAQSHLLTLLEHFEAISVRDNHSKYCLESLINRNITVCLDPTLLISKDQYFRNAENCNEKNYIALYLHERHITEKNIQLIQKLSNILNKKLISLNMYLSWCDRNVASKNIFDFYINADYVITTTFHGAAFAINFEKQFITISNNNNKVSELLKMFNLLDRNINDGNAEKMIDLLQKPIDYEPIRRELGTQRKVSLEYISSSIKGKVNYGQ